MLEYSDNFAWVNDTVKKQIEASAPLSEILLTAPVLDIRGAHGAGNLGHGVFAGAV